MTINEASRILNVSKSYVYRLIRDGTLTTRESYNTNNIVINNESVLKHIDNKKGRGRPRKKRD